MTPADIRKLADSAEWVTAKFDDNIPLREVLRACADVVEAAELNLYHHYPVNKCWTSEALARLVAIK